MPGCGAPDQGERARVVKALETACNKNDLDSKNVSAERFFSLMQRNRTSGLEIGPKTAIPLWEGERMDDGMAVEGLLQME